MSFLYPATLFFGLLAAGVVALYLQRPKRRRLEVSSLLFWQRVLEREPQRQFLGRLRHPLSLLLQLLIFLFLLLSLARPEGRSAGRQSSVVILDARARMQAGETFRAAVRSAMNVASQAGANHEVALLAVEGSPVVLSSFTTDGRELREKLGKISVSDAGGGMEETLALARNLLAGREGGKKLVVVTDRPLENPGDAEEILVGKGADNVAILALAQRSLPSSPQSAEVLARLGNFSKQDRKVELELSLDGRPFDMQHLEMKAGEELNLSTLISEDLLRGGQGFFRARLTSPDDLAVDNEARAAISTGGQLRVLLVTANNPFLESALKASPNIAMDILTPENWKNGMGGGFDAVIFDGWLPDGATVESLGTGAFLFFGRSPFQSSDEPEKAFGLEQTEPQSPLLWNVDVSAFLLDRARQLKSPADPGWRVSAPLESGGLPVLLALESPQRQRMVATAFGIGDTDFPLRVGFPLFISNVVHWLAGRDGEGMGTLKAGQTFVPADKEEIGLNPRQEAGLLTGETSSRTREPIRLKKNGYYELRSMEDERVRWLAVNTASREESDLREARTGNKVLTWALGWGGLHPWQWLGLAAFVLILAEWFLHHRRITE